MECIEWCMTAMDGFATVCLKTETKKNNKESTFRVIGMSLNKI